MVVTMRARAGSSVSIGVLRLFLLAPLGVLVLAPAALATEVRFPLSVEHPVLQSALRKHLREQSGGTLELWRTADGGGSLLMRGVTVQAPQAAELRALLGLFAGQTRSAALLGALQAMRPVGIAVEPEAVRVMLAIDIPTVPPAPRGPEAALTPAQVKRWEAALDRWDGFLGFIVKNLAAATPDPAVRQELLDLLLAARYDLVSILGRGPEPGADPVKALFVGVWSRLRAIARRIPPPQGDEGRALRVLVFLSAGDALAAIDATAPSAGVEFSAD